MLIKFLIWHLFFINTCAYEYQRHENARGKKINTWHEKGREPGKCYCTPLLNRYIQCSRPINSSATVPLVYVSAWHHGVPESSRE